EDAELLTVTAAGRSGVDAVLPQGATAAGTVTGPDGELVPNVSVNFYRVVNGVQETSLSGSGYGANGTWTTSSPLEPGTYRVSFYAQGYEQRFHPDGSIFGSGDDVELVAGEQKNLVTTMVRRGALSGTVTGPDGRVAG